jgi:hypothetical protein
MIKVENPCPMSYGRLKNDNGFYCKSCSKTLIDFRDKSTDEIIKQISTKSVCGVFNTAQITVPVFSFKTNLLFKALTLLAILGFNVKPLNAQTKQEILQDKTTLQKRTLITNTTLDIPINTTTSLSKTVASTQKKWWHKKKKLKIRTIGCPSF